ncbi:MULTISPECIES: DUF2946 family protein [Achromobacter]|uniref:DUF2946 domain-containing protein n=1 Tax=Achromobacter spanius TaxID=217203 RepID=A0ABY8GXG1_9BURK|nr:MULTISPECIES: DUF2946 family protein [Achromobacter]WAI81553.1 hypothetical protein N8Z00_18665 [Achromobacter spanius]WEX97070.1 hypothetical protein N3Z32_13270 [Achromobacter sp. SS2-2022]WFP09213.1 hypothetical protein P8T11_04840 [Achromobacter spanius]
MRTGLSRRLPRFASAADFGRLLLLLLLVARAWVPTGYMPDADALRQGRLALGFCTAGGNVMAALHSLGERQAPGDGHQAMHGDHMLHADEGHHGHHGAGHDDERGAGQECPFGLSAHQILNLPPLAAVAPVLLRWLAQRPPKVEGVRPPMPAAGPPLGQRAPPSIRG